MVQVTYESRFNKPTTSYYDFAHNARTVLLLAGYLPSEEDESTYINVYTRETAYIKIIGRTV